MEWTPFRITLALAMLVTGSINTLSTKWADLQESVGKDGESGSYVHPFLQAVGMFLGELTCLFAYFIVVYRRRNRAYSDISDGGADTAVELPFNPLIMLPASLCDMCGTTIMYIGLNLTYASSFQMLRGAVMIFTAILSVLFLKRRIKCYMWVGMLFVIIGLILVGVADIVLGDVSQSHMNNNGTNMSTVAPDTDQSKDIKNIITGDALIIVAQVIVATQMVYEEKFVSRYNVPALKAVGLEGLFGFTILGLLLIPLYYIKVPVGTYQWLTTDYEGRIENTPNAFVQMGNNHIIIYATVGNIISIAFFNFCGISVTKEMSATTRMVLDSCRTLIIWMLGYAFLWQRFHVGEFFVQLAGFAFLIIGMMIYNNLVVMPLLRQYVFRTTDSDDVIVNRSEDEDEADERTPILRNASSYDDSRPTPIL